MVHSSSFVPSMVYHTNQRSASAATNQSKRLAVSGINSTSKIPPDVTCRKNRCHIFRFLFAVPVAPPFDFTHAQQPQSRLLVPVAAQPWRGAAWLFVVDPADNPIASRLSDQQPTAVWKVRNRSIAPHHLPFLCEWQACCIRTNSGGVFRLWRSVQHSARDELTRSGPMIPSLR